MKSPIIILHGWGLSGDTFLPLARQLQNSGFSVTAPDLPGFGSSVEPDHPMSVTEYALFLNRYLLSHHIENPILIGHSFGGRVAIVYTSMYPDRVKTLVLTGTPGFRSVSRTHLSLAKTAAIVGNALFSLPPFFFLKRFARGILYRILRVHDYTRVSGVMQETFKRVVDEDLFSAMKRIQVPTLLIWGEEDHTVPVQVARKMQQVIRDAKLVVIPGENHRIPYANPKKFTEETTAFLSK